MKHTKIAIIGAGAVGATTAYSILWKNIAAEIILVDPNKQLSHGNVMDLSDAIPFSSTTSVQEATPAQAGQADIIIIAAGARQKPGQSRSDLLSTNWAVVTSIIKSMQPINKYAIIIMVTNPVDIMAYCAQRVSGLDKNQVFGSGTWLDSQRLRRLVAQKIGISSQSIQAFMLGEHGDTQFAAWSCSHIGGIPVNSYQGLNRESLQIIESNAKNLVYSIIECKQATYYGIGACIADICECIIFNQRKILPLSSYIKEFDVSISIPVILGERGIERSIAIPLNQHEKEQLQRSAEHIKSLITALGF